MSWANQRQKIYKGDMDYRRFEMLLGEVIQGHSFVLYAYVLMPNHFHLLLEVGRAPLSKAYTRRYNQHYRKIGQLFYGDLTSASDDPDSCDSDLSQQRKLVGVA